MAADNTFNSFEELLERLNTPVPKVGATPSVPTPGYEDAVNDINDPTGESRYNFAYSSDGKLYIKPKDEDEEEAVSPTYESSQLASDPTVSNSDFLGSIGDLYQKPISKEEQERRERAASAAQGVATLGNAVGALGNLFYVNKGAKPQKLATLPDYGETINGYKNSMEQARNNYANVQMRVNQAKAEQALNQAKMAATQAEKQAAIDKAQAYIENMRAGTQKNYYQGKLYELEYNQKNSPEYKENQQEQETAKTELAKAKVEDTKAATEQKHSATNLNNARASHVGEGGGSGGRGGSGGSGKGKHVIKERGGKVVTLSDEEFKQRLLQEGIPLTKKSTSGAGPNKKTTTTSKSDKELEQDLNDAYSRKKTKSATKKREKGSTNKTSKAKQKVDSSDFS